MVQSPCLLWGVQLVKGTVMKVFLLQVLLLFHRKPLCVQFCEKHLIEGEVIKVVLFYAANVKVELVAAHVP